MNYYYSKKTGGFYTEDSDIDFTDMIKLTEAEHAALFEKQSEGEEICVENDKVITKPRVTA